MQRLQRRLTPAQTVPVCLWCPTSSASARVSKLPGPLTSESTASTLRRFWRRDATLLIRLSIQLECSDAAFTLTVTRAGPIPNAQSPPLNQPTTRPYSFQPSESSRVQKLVYKAGFEPISAAKGMSVLQLYTAVVIKLMIRDFIERLAIRRESPLSGASRFARFAIRTTRVTGMSA